MSQVFKRIWVKAGLEPKKKLGWDSIRQRLDNLLKDVYLPQTSLSPSLLDDYIAGEKVTSDRPVERGNSGDYRQPENLDSDTHGIDRIIYSIHPFLPLWQKKR